MDPGDNWANIGLHLTEGKPAEREDGNPGLGLAFVTDSLFYLGRVAQPLNFLIHDMKILYTKLRDKALLEEQTLENQSLEP